MAIAERILLAVGGYTPDGAAGGDGPPGLTTWWWDGTGTTVEAAGSADLPSPSFACWHPTLPVLYAVSELADGVVTTLGVDADGALADLASTPTLGADPCWVTVDPAGIALLIANYTSGSMTVVGLDEAGLPSGEPVVVSHTGSGPVADRQAAPHVHQVVPTADGHVLASDLGADLIAEYRIDPAAAAGAPGRRRTVTVTQVGSIAMPAGSGPRHIALAADGLTGFVTGELDGTVTVIRREPAPGGGPGHWTAAEHVPCSTHPGTAANPLHPSQVVLADGDRWLLVANRGPDTVAVLDVADRLRIRHEVPTSAGPRYFTVVGDRVLLAGQHDNAVDLLTLDEPTGSLTRVGVLRAGPGMRSPFRSPSCVAVRR